VPAERCHCLGGTGLERLEKVYFDEYRRKGATLPMEIDSLVVLIIALFLLVILGVLLGPSFFSSYQNWKIKKGAK
jgi:hypothetical protein